MKRLSTLLLAAVMVLGMAACGNKSGLTNPDGTEPVNRLEEIKARGYLEVVTEPYFAPNEFIDSTKTGDDKYVGSDIELAKYIAEKLGVELRIIPLEFSAVLTSITEGKYDMAISALAYTPERAEAMELSDGYYIDPNSKGYGFLVREEDVGLYNSMEDFNGKTVVCQAASIQEVFANTQMEIGNLKELIRVSSSNDAYLMVSEKKADAAICAIASADLYAGANGGLKTLENVKFWQDPEYSGTRVGMTKGETELLEAVNEAIREVNESGQYEEWYEAYSEYAKTLGVTD